jgi:UDP-3-O-[3-hydroxymyristoyl] N-acetylglucosamine deacetylase/3-hydroxyacyl-[acyl-carrier-protein] dehydratase
VIWLQKTVGADVTFEGVGLHTGQPSRLVLRPAPLNTGLVFRVASGADTVEIPAHADFIPDGEAAVRNTTLARGDTTVCTVEHLLAALYGLGVTNCWLDLEGGEPPVVGCGSAIGYVEGIEAVGIETQGAPAGYFRITAPVAWRDGDVEIVAEPCDHLRLTMDVDYDDPVIGRQSASFEIRPDTFARELAPARTFAYMADVLKMREMGYAKGGTLETALVIEDGKLAEGQSLRFDDEFVRHKMLDLLGDLALVGMPVQGHIRARKSGHAAHAAFTRLLARAEKRSSRIYPRRRPEDFDIAAILEIMPHRYPLLLVDRITELVPGKRVVGLKNVTINEPFFQGHFPNHPIMPGVLIIEALAQAGGVLLMTTVEEPRGKLVYFSGIDGARFRRPALPGDTLTLECELLKLKGPICKMRALARIGDEKVAEAELMASIVDA